MLVLPLSLNSQPFTRRLQLVGSSRVPGTAPASSPYTAHIASSDRVQSRWQSRFAPHAANGEGPSAHRQQPAAAEASPAQPQDVSEQGHGRSGDDADGESVASAEQAFDPAGPKELMARFKAGEISQEQLVEKLQEVMSATELEEALEEVMLSAVAADVRSIIRSQIGQLTPEEQAAIEEIDVTALLSADMSFEEMQRKILEPMVNAGPIAESLEALGVQESPYDFVTNVITLGLMLQLGSIAAVFYGTELGLHYNAGEAFRAASGLFLGGLTRPLVRSEAFVWPALSALLKLVPGSETSQFAQFLASSPEQGSVSSATNGVVAVLAAALLVPQVLLGWSVQECLQLAVPIGAGWAVFDLTCMLAMWIRLDRS